MTVDEYLEACQELERHSDQVIHFLFGFTAAKIPAKHRAAAIEQARKIYGPKS